MALSAMDHVRHNTAGDGFLLPRYRAALARLIAGIDDDLRPLVGRVSA
jgi:hypothetical protein